MVLAALVSLALMLADHRYHQLEAVRSVLAVVLSPLQFVIDLPRTGSEWISETLATRSRLQRENRLLRKQNLKLQAQQQKLDALRAENRRLRNLLDSSLKIGERVLIAELIGVDLDPYRQQVLINKGERSGIYRGQPVLDAHGVMGQVVHLSRFSSTVLLITDASHALPVQVNRNGLRSVAVGTGRIDALRLQHLPNNADIEVGDLLVTSGLGGRFPPGYPVATVVSVSRLPGEQFARVEARPLAQLDQIREVLLAWTLDRNGDSLLLSPADETAPAATGEGVVE